MSFEENPQFTPTSDGIVVEYIINHRCNDTAVILKCEEVTPGSSTVVYSVQLFANSSSHTVPERVLSQCRAYRVTATIIHTPTEGVVSEQSGVILAGRLCVLNIKTF